MFREWKLLELFRLPKIGLQFLPISVTYNFGQHELSKISLTLVPQPPKIRNGPRSPKMRLFEVIFCGLFVCLKLKIKVNTSEISLIVYIMMIIKSAPFSSEFILHSV